MSIERRRESVVLLASRWDYGDPARGDSFEYEYFFSSMRNVVDRVEFVDCNELKGLDPDAQFRILSTRVESVEATMVFSVLFRDEVAYSVLGRLRDQVGIPVVNWFCDDHWRYDTFSRHIAPFLSLAVTTDNGASERYSADGFRYLQSQWGVPLSRVSDLTVQHPADKQVSFIGQVYGRRGSTLDAISRALGPGVLQVYGFGTPNGRVTVEQMYELFNRSAVALNFADSWNGRIRETIGRFFPSVRRPRQLKARTFEVPGAGGVLVTHKTPHLGDYYEVGREVLTAETASEFTETCRALIADASLREQIATAARSRTLRDHTVESRLDDVFRALDR